MTERDATHPAAPRDQACKQILHRHPHLPVERVGLARRIAVSPLGGEGHRGISSPARGDTLHFSTGGEGVRTVLSRKPDARRRAAWRVGESRRLGAEYDVGGRRDAPVHRLILMETTCVFDARSARRARPRPHFDFRAVDAPNPDGRKPASPPGRLSSPPEAGEQDPAKGKDRVVPIFFARVGASG